METSGLKALNAITSSSLHLLRFTSRAPPPLRCLAFFSLRSNSLRHSSLRFSPLCSFCKVSSGCIAEWPRCGGGGEASSNKEFLQVVLMSPQIPGNTGCIARTCAASAVRLHLIEPLGFQIDDAKLKRAGLDYWPKGDWLVFGSETRGLPAEALADCQNDLLGGDTIRIPMVETFVRCLNLSVSVGIALYEASRQLNY